MRLTHYALVALTLMPVTAVAQTLPPPGAMAMGTRLDIVAEGVATRKPDIAEISAGVVTQAETAAAAMRDNAARMTRVIAALKKAGVAERDIRTASISLSPQYRYGENQPPVLTGYQASNQVSIHFRDITRAGTILDALVGEGANQINGPVFSLDKAEEALDEARRDAVAKARARAQLYATAAGLKVGRILSISENGAAPPPRPMPVMMMSARAEAKSADTAVEAGESRLTMSLNVSFELE